MICTELYGFSCNISVLQASIIKNHFEHYLKQIYLTPRWEPKKFYHSQVCGAGSHGNRTSELETHQ